ncbi:MAG: diguanylate cyclase [Pseudomonadota bacterium]
MHRQFAHQPPGPFPVRPRILSAVLSLLALPVLLAVYGDAHAQSADFSEAINEAQRTGALDDAETLAKDALNTPRAQSDPLFRGEVLRELAEGYITQNRYDEAEQQLTNSLQVLEPLGITEAFGRAQFQMARLFRYRVEYATALDWLSQAEKTFSALGNQEGLHDVYSLHGVISRFLGQLEQSLNWHSRALSLARTLDDEAGVADDLFNIAGVHESLGEHAEALVYYEDVLELDEAAGFPGDIAYSRIRMGMMQIELGQYADARANILKARELFASIDTPRDYQWAIAALARLDAAEGQIAQARATLEAVLEKSESGGWPVLANRARQWLSDLEYQDGQLDAALGYLDSALADALAQDSMLRALMLYERQVRVLEAAGRPGDALEAMRKLEELRLGLSDALRASVLASMQGEADFERQSVALELAQKERALSELALERESTFRIVGFGALGLAFLIAFLVYGRLLARRQNERLTTEVEQKTRELRERNEDLEEAYAAVERASVTDPLTGLANRRFLERNIDADASRALRLWTDAVGAPVAQAPKAGDLVFFLIDLDRFKQINDELGHAAGDAVLVEISRIVDREFRKEDFKVRWGGEEFLVVARFIDRQQASAIASRVCAAVAAHEFPVDGNGPIRCTCSIGFATFPLSPDAPAAARWQDVVGLADHAMYLVKQGHRNGWAGLDARGAVTPDQPVADWAPAALARGELVVLRSDPTG